MPGTAKLGRRLADSSLLLRYLAALLITAAATGVRLLMDPVLGFKIPYATFFIAVAISTVLGGWGPGMLSTVCGAVAALYFILPPRHHPTVITGLDNQLGFAVYLIVSALLIVLGELQNRARARARRELAKRHWAEAGEREQRR